MWFSSFLITVLKARTLFFLPVSVRTLFNVRLTIKTLCRPYVACLALCENTRTDALLDILQFHFVHHQGSPSRTVRSADSFWEVEQAKELRGGCGFFFPPFLVTFILHNIGPFKCFDLNCFCIDLTLHFNLFSCCSSSNPFDTILIFSERLLIV